MVTTPKESHHCLNSGPQIVRQKLCHWQTVELFDHVKKCSYLIGQVLVNGKCLENKLNIKRKNIYIYKSNPI